MAARETSAALCGWMVLGIVGFAPANLPAGVTNSPWHTRVWQSEDGLPGGVVNGLAQTQDGYLWLGTAPLTRFDGVRFERFDSSRLVKELERRTEVLLASRDGSLWLAMDGGVVVHLQAGETRVFDIGAPERIAQAALEDHEGTIWLAYRSGPVVRIHEGQMNFLSSQDGWPAEYGLPALVEDSERTIWFAKNGRVGVFQNGRFKSLHRFSEPVRIQLALCRTGGVWVCAGARLMKADREGKLEEPGAVPVEHSWTVPTAMIEDGSGAVWIGTSDSGLFHYDDSGFQSVPTSHPQILSLMEDRERNLWAGTGGGDLNQIQPRVFDLETAETGLPFETLRSLCEDRKGDLWAATQNGLAVHRTGQKWSVLSDAPAELAGNATCVTADRFGSLWFGTRVNELYHWRNGEWTSWQETDGLKPRVIRGLFAGTNDVLWIAGDNPRTLQSFRDGKWTTINLPQSARFIQAMTEDSRGNLWVGTVNGMLFEVTGDSTTNLAAALTVNRSIRCLHAAADGSLWIGTGGAGLVRFRNGRSTRINLEQGLPDDHLSQLEEDGLGWFWFGSNGGIFKIRDRDLEQTAEGNIPRVHAIRYGRDVGLPNLQATFGYVPASLRTRDGYLWMPALTALVGINPKNPRPHLEPPVLLKRFVVDEQTALFDGGAIPAAGGDRHPNPVSGLKISPKHHRLEFEFTALSLSAPEELSFRYRLEGIDEGWIENGPQRSAVYSRLPAGNYLFRVTARNSEGVWNENAATLAFIVTPFFWQTWWFRLTALAAFTSLVVMLARYVSFRRLRLKLQAVEQEAALDRERARIARDLHDDLGTGLTGIVLLSGLALRDREHPQKAGLRVQEILTKARQVIKALDEIVWAVNPTNDTVTNLIDYISQFAVEFLQPAGVQCRVDLLNESPEWTVSSEARHNLFLIVKECLNNTIRHAGARQVRMRFAVTEEALGLTIEDDGEGFGSNQPTGHGLGNMKQRMAEMGGQIQIQSQPGQGTQVSISLPWTKGMQKP